MSVACLVSTFCACLAPFAQFSRLRRCPGCSGFRQVTVIVCVNRTRARVTQILGTCARLHLWCCHIVPSIPSALLLQLPWGKCGRQHGPLMLACTVLPCDFWETYHGACMLSLGRGTGPRTLQLTRLWWRRSACLDR